MCGGGCHAPPPRVVRYAYGQSTVRERDNMNLDDAYKQAMKLVESAMDRLNDAKSELPPDAPDHDILDHDLKTLDEAWETLDTSITAAREGVW